MNREGSKAHFWCQMGTASVAMTQHRLQLGHPSSEQLWGDYSGPKSFSCVRPFVCTQRLLSLLETFQSPGAGRGQLRVDIMNFLLEKAMGLILRLFNKSLKKEESE